MDQVDKIEHENGCVEGYINWQGVLNNAYRLRGERLFLDLATDPESARHVFDCVATTMIDCARRLHERQRLTGVEVCHFTVSNCVVNMISPGHYREFLLPFDRRISEIFGLIGVHKCAPGHHIHAHGCREQNFRTAEKRPGTYCPGLRSVRLGFCRH
jgi:hypothetical protein